MIIFAACYWALEKVIIFSTRYWDLKKVTISSFFYSAKSSLNVTLLVTVRDSHGGGWSRKINAWHLYTLMVYL
jgi:hypothetical protein